jgi:hypothetical protein
VRSWVGVRRLGLGLGLGVEVGVGVAGLEVGVGVAGLGLRLGLGLGGQGRRTLSVHSRCRCWNTIYKAVPWKPLNYCWTTLIQWNGPTVKALYIQLAHKIILLLGIRQRKIPLLCYKCI